MKTAEILAVGMIAATLCACNKNYTKDFLIVDNHNHSHTISEEKALNDLKFFLSELNVLSTKNSADKDVKLIESVKTISAKVISTKSNCYLPENTGSVIYLVNFENNSGYAIVSADDRIDADIISIVDEGNISDADIENILTSNYEFRDYSSLVDSLDYTVYDTLVFEHEDSVALVEPITESRLASYYDYYHEPLVGNALNNGSVEATTLRMSLDYAVREIQDYDTECSSSYYTIRTTSYSNTNIIVYPLLKGVTDEWHQGAPFNNNCPWVQPSIMSRISRRADAGCVPLSVAQILAYFQYPDVMDINGTIIDWNAIRGSNFDKNDVGKESSAVLLRHVGNVCHSLYFYGGTFTFPSFAVSALRSFGFRNVELNSYNTNIVIDKLNDGCPIFICSIPSKNWYDYDFNNSHGWLLDGYLTRNKIITTQRYIDGSPQGVPTTTSEGQTMIHCNFGWGGMYNGYFVSGVFNLGGNETTYDDPYYSGKKSTYYNYYLKTICYDNPRK